MNRNRTFYVACEDCHQEWLADFTPQGFAVDSLGEECPECGSNVIEQTQEYIPYRWIDPTKTFFLVLIVPNLLLFGGLS